MQWSYDCHTARMCVVECRVKVVQQGITNLEGINGTLGDLGKAYLCPVTWVLVSCVQCVVGATVRVVGAQLEPSSTQLRRCVKVVTANVGARL